MGRRLLALTLPLALLACSGEQGPPGDQGDQGAPGDQGLPGDPGDPAVDDGTISGVIEDELGAPVAGVDIVTEPASLGATTDAAGAFSLAGVPIGVYSLVATLTGYQDLRLPGVGVAAGATTDVGTLTLLTEDPTSGSISGTIYQANGTALAGATVSAEGQAATATSAADGTYTLTGVAPGMVFVTATPATGDFLPGETRRSSAVVAGETVAGVDITLSGRPSDAATYAGSAACSACHSDVATGHQGSAHSRSLTLGQTRMGNLALFPALGGTAATGVNARSPVDGTSTVATYACQNAAGVYSFKFGGTADCTVADGTLIPVAGTYGGEGDHGIEGVANLGRFKQRYFAALADVPLAGAWTYTAGKDKDFLIIPVQITQSGDSAPRFEGYKAADWLLRTRTFARACAGCHNVGFDATFETTSGNYYVTDFNYTDLNVGCETCHGPGSEHLAATVAQKKNKIITPDNLTAQLAREACGGCHGGDASKSIDPDGKLPYGYNLANVAKVGNGIFVPGVYDVRDYIKGYGVPMAEGGAVDLWPDGVHGKAHRQQAYMLDLSTHTNNPYLKLVCSNCHDQHTGYQGPEAFTVAAGSDVYQFTTPTFKDNTLCLGCHAGYGPYAAVDKEAVAIGFLKRGGAVSKNGTAMALGSFTTAQINAALVEVAGGVGGHMEETVNMGAAAYNPLLDAMPVGRCSSCHMAQTAKSGGWTTGLDGTGASAMVSGDQGSHVFDIVWPYQSGALKTATSVDTDIMPNACGLCHAGSRVSGN